MTFVEFLDIVFELLPCVHVDISEASTIWQAGHDAFTAAMALGESDLATRLAILECGLN